MLVIFHFPLVRISKCLSVTTTQLRCSTLATRPRTATLTLTEPCASRSTYIQGGFSNLCCHHTAAKATTSCSKGLNAPGENEAAAHRSNAAGGL